METFFRIITLVAVVISFAAVLELKQTRYERDCLSDAIRYHIDCGNDSLEKDVDFYLQQIGEDKDYLSKWSYCY